MPTPSRSRRVRWTVLATLLVLLQLWGGTIGWAQQAVRVVAASATDGQARLVVDVRDGARSPLTPQSFSVTADGQTQPARAGPLLSDRLAMALVVDASQDGGRVLQPGLNGLVDFVLTTPSGARGALVTDTTPPSVVAPLQPGPTRLLPGLSMIEPHDGRQTADALDLAVQQLPPEADSPRLVVLYTGAPDVTDQPAADLGMRLTGEGIVLAVVTTAADGAVPAYWSTVSAATGGVAEAARTPGVVPGVAAAFDRLTAALRSRYQLTLPVPGELPCPAVVRVATPSGALTTDTVIPAQAGAGTGDALPVIIAEVGFAVVALLAGVVLIARTRRRAPPEPPPHEQPETPPDEPPEPPQYEPPPAATASPDQLEHRAWNVPARCEPVIDRKPLLAAIRRTLREGRPVVLAPGEGRAGVGITTAMIEFAHRNRDDYDIVWWIAAQDPQLVVEQMAQLAEAIGLAALTDMAEQATAGLLDALGRRSRWLLVFDDAESPYQLARFLPGGFGHVLVASTDLRWGEQTAPLVVPPFTRNQSVQLLWARHTGLPRNEAARVAAPLEDLPLTVDTAAATLAESGMGVHAYLRLVSEHPASAVWSVAFERLAADDPTALALLTLLGWLGPEPFPLSLLTRHPGLLPAALAESAQARPQLAEQAATLQRRALARVDGEIVQVHRVPAAQLVGRTVADRAEGVGWAARVVRLLRAVAPADPADPAGWPLWRQLLPHVLTVTDPARLLDDVTAEVAWLLGHGAGFLLARGEPSSALALSKDSYDLYRHRLGRDHPDTQTSARTLTDGLHALGWHDQARRVIEEARIDAATDPRRIPDEPR